MQVRILTAEVATRVSQKDFPLCLSAVKVGSKQTRPGMVRVYIHPDIDYLAHGIVGSSALGMYIGISFLAFLKWEFKKAEGSCAFARCSVNIVAILSVAPENRWLHISTKKEAALLPPACGGLAPKNG